MRTIVISTVFAAIFYQTIQAGIYSDNTSFEESAALGQTYLTDIFPGKLVATDSNGKEWHDYATAVPINFPGKNQTTSILSCAHLFFISHTFGCTLQYHTFDGKIYDVKKVLPRTHSIHTPGAAEDLALYYLSESVLCNPLNSIPLTIQPKSTFSTINYGWTMRILNNQSILGNLRGEKAYAINQDYEYDGAGTYIHNYTADRVVSLFDGSKYAANYLSEEGDFQVFYHDSGSPWFSRKQEGGFYVDALSSRFTEVMSDSLASADDMIDSLLSESTCLSDSDTEFSIKILKLRYKKTFQTILTPLAPHREWIHWHIK